MKEKTKTKLLLIGSLIVLILLFNVLGKLTERGKRGCIENGYSETYCIQHS